MRDLEIVVVVEDISGDLDRELRFQGVKINLFRAPFAQGSVLE